MNVPQVFRSFQQFKRKKGESESIRQIEVVTNDRGHSARKLVTHGKNCIENIEEDTPSYNNNKVKCRGSSWNKLVGVAIDSTKDTFADTKTEATERRLSSFLPRYRLLPRVAICSVQLFLELPCPLSLSLLLLQRQQQHQECPRHLQIKKFHISFLIHLHIIRYFRVYL